MIYVLGAITVAKSNSTAPRPQRKPHKPKKAACDTPRGKDWPIFGEPRGLSARHSVQASHDVSGARKWQPARRFCDVSAAVCAATQHLPRNGNVNSACNPTRSGLDRFANRGKGGSARAYVTHRTTGLADADRHGLRIGLSGRQPKSQLLPLLVADRGRRANARQTDWTRLFQQL